MFQLFSYSAGARDDKGACNSHLSPISRTHINVKGKNQLHMVVLWLRGCAMHFHPIVISEMKLEGKLSSGVSLCVTVVAQHSILF